MNNRFSRRLQLITMNRIVLLKKVHVCVIIVIQHLLVVKFIICLKAAT